MAYVPYTIPGFALAKSVADVFDANPNVDGLDSSAARHLHASPKMRAKPMSDDRDGDAGGRAAREAAQELSLQAQLPTELARTAEIAPILRGACAIARDEQARGTVEAANPVLPQLAADPGICERRRTCRAIRKQGVVTPDHTIRTKNWPLVVPAPEADKLDDWETAVEKPSPISSRIYHAYFARNNARAEPKKTELDPCPRVVLVPGMACSDWARRPRTRRSPPTSRRTRSR